MNTPNANSFFLSSLSKKYFMAATGPFLIVFLIGHLSGNLQLFLPGYEGKLQFNEYAVFMTTFPVVKILSYVTYFCIVFHIVDAILLTIQNRKARPQRYAYSRPDRNTNFSSRNMMVLGSLILIFLGIHMYAFWAQYHWNDQMPIMMHADGVSPLLKETSAAIKGGQVVGTDIVLNGEVMGPVMKDLHGIVMAAYQIWWVTAFYVLSMVVLGFHLWHGFASGFQSLGLNHPRYMPILKKTGYAFAVIVPALFAAIPLYIFFFVKP
ncbi:succinate dehydrogenase [soil metagenome]